MTAQTAIADVLDAIYDLWSTDPTLTATEGIDFFDGPIGAGDRTAGAKVIVGAEDWIDDDQDAGTGTASWAQASTLSDIDETLTIPCAVWVGRGGDDMRARRREAVTLYNRCAELMRGEDFGMTPPVQVLWSYASGSALRQEQGQDGAAVLLSFTVTVRTRIY